LVHAALLERANIKYDIW